MPHLDQLLLDRSALLRRAAQARALASGYDLRSEYRESLPQRTAVLGLGEIGEPADAELLAALVVVDQLRQQFPEQLSRGESPEADDRGSPHRGSVRAADERGQ